MYMYILFTFVNNAAIQFRDDMHKDVKHTCTCTSHQHQSDRIIPIMF